MYEILKEICSFCEVLYKKWMHRGKEAGKKAGKKVQNVRSRNSRF
jgi:hypothetical protein